MTENRYSEQCAAFDKNYPVILERISRAAEKSGRRMQDITLLAATKTVPGEVVAHAVQKGISCVGENRVQEFLEKQEYFDRTLCDVQFIGRLQTNKVKYLIDNVSMIQSVDSLHLAQEISRQCQLKNSKMNVLLEVNIGKEESKGGVMPEELPEFVDQVRALPGISIRGLMTIPPETTDPKELFRCFSAMREYYVDIAGKKMDNVYMECLSMGMSSDFAQAIECGATMVRIGSSLFGRRLAL